RCGRGVMRRIGIVAAVLVSLVSARPVARQAQTPPPQRAEGTVAAQATAIMVDVVVRDRRGNPVTDLRPEDFELFEDGVRQEIGSVVFYGRPDAGGTAGPAPTPASASAGASAAPPQGALPSPPPVIALVFDRLSPEARTLAYKAALGYVGREGNDALVGVFGIDLSLITYQTFTSDPQRLTKALEELAMRSTSQFTSTASEMREASGRAAGFAQAAAGIQAGAGAGPAAGQAASAAAGAAVEAQLAEMERRRLETFEMLERDQQGYATTHGLLALVNAMRTMPGRKSMIFFSEGLALPPAVASQFRSLIDTANRANVSIYAMDAAGLRTDSTQAEIRDQLNAAAARRLAQNPSADVVGSAMTAALEINEDRLRADPHAGLGQLTA